MTKIKLEKIISGGQTGVDQAGLRAAERLRLRTSGWMPLGYRTQSGPNPSLAKSYGLKQHPSASYPPRTKRNVSESDATIILGHSNSPGCKLTIKYCQSQETRRPFTIITFGDSPFEAINEIQRFMIENDPVVLNVAGNREESYPGIGAWAERVLVYALGPLVGTLTSEENDVS